MNSGTPSSTPSLPLAVEEMLAELVTAARKCFGEELRSVILFGSGAEGRLRPTSDVNLLLVLKRFAPDQVDGFREPLRVAQMAQRAMAMFVLEGELALAAEAFAVKFDDIARRRRVLYGEDIGGRITPPRAARIQRLRQMTMNLILRLRERYVAVSLRELQLVLVIADAAGSLRAAAATLLELEGQPAPSGREALEVVAQTVDLAGATELLNHIRQARLTRLLPPGTAGPTLFRLIALAEAMRARAERLA